MLHFWEKLHLKYSQCISCALQMGVKHLSLSQWEILVISNPAFHTASPLRTGIWTVPVVLSTIVFHLQKLPPLICLIRFSKSNWNIMYLVCAYIESSAKCQMNGNDVFIIFPSLTHTTQCFCTRYLYFVFMGP